MYLLLLQKHPNCAQMLQHTLLHDNSLHLRIQIIQQTGPRKNDVGP
jgi:hypothetical protein